MNETEKRFPMSKELIELRDKVKAFINEWVIPVEQVIDERDEDGLKVLKEVQEQAKQRGLWVYQKRLEAEASSSWTMFISMRLLGGQRLRCMLLGHTRLKMGQC